jgi:(1->4)-alpha-D-glucan 1-alpha-D-glucosylmutase
VVDGRAGKRAVLLVRGSFRIDWSPFDAELAGRVLVPVLGDPYAAVLERGELRLAFEPERGAFAIEYFGHRFPIDPREFPTLVAPALERVAGALPPDAVAAATQLVAMLRALPPRTARAADAVAAPRAARKQAASRRCSRRATGRFADAIVAVVTDFNGVQGETRELERLHALLEAQAFRLAYWRVAADEINYRRFFDINDLAALRMENDAVFDADARVHPAARGGKIHGCASITGRALRPRRNISSDCRRGTGNWSPGPACPAGAEPPVYVVLEKILASHERLPADWPVSGTTGYRFANLVNGFLFVAGAAQDRLDRTWGARSSAPKRSTTRPPCAARSKRSCAVRSPPSSRCSRSGRCARQGRSADARLHVQRAAPGDRGNRRPLSVYRTYVAAAGRRRRIGTHRVGRRARAAQSRAADGAAYSISCAP